MKKLIVVILILITIVFCTVVWAGLDAGGEALINCPTIQSDTATITLDDTVRITGGATVVGVLNTGGNLNVGLTGTFNGGLIVSGGAYLTTVTILGNIIPYYDGTSAHGSSTLGSSTKRFKTLWTSENIHIGTSSADYRIDAQAGGDIGSDTFTGTGLNDLTAAGTFNGTVADDVDYKVEIDANGTPDTFKWSDDGGSTWDVEDVNLTGSAQTLNNGITVTFDANDGHTTGDYWTWTVTIYNPMWLQDAAGDGVLEVRNDGQVIFTGDSAAAATTVSAWEIDGSDDLMPITGMFNDPDYDLDSNGDLMPAQIIYFETDTNGNLMPNL